MNLQSLTLLLPAIRRMRRAATWLIWLMIAVGLILRFTVRDRYFPWYLVLYMTPLPALVVWQFIATFIGSPPKSWRRTADGNARQSWFSPARLSLFLIPIFVVWTACSEFVNRGQRASNELRIVFWNVARCGAGVSSLATSLKLADASVIALVEADKKFTLVVDEWQTELPDYQVVGTGFGGILAVKGTVVSQHRHQLTPRSPCEQFDVKVDDTEFTVLLVDIASDLGRSRRKPLQALATLAEELADRRVVIVGDFNTPDDSIWFSPLRQTHRQAFREHGTGYAATWPMPLPVLTLDQIWVNDRIQVAECRMGWSFYSDHRSVVCELAFGAPRQK